MRHSENLEFHPRREGDRCERMKRSLAPPQRVWRRAVNTGGGENRHLAVRNVISNSKAMTTGRAPAPAADHSLGPRTRLPARLCAALSLSLSRSICFTVDPTDFVNRTNAYCDFSLWLVAVRWISQGVVNGHEATGSGRGCGERAGGGEGGHEGPGNGSE